MNAKKQKTVSTPIEQYDMKGSGKKSQKRLTRKKEYLPRIKRQKKK